MAFDYTIFEDLGKLIKYYDEAKTEADGLDADLQAIITQFDLNDRIPIIDGLASQYAGFPEVYRARRAVFTQFAARRLQDQETVLEELAIADTSLDTILLRLHEQMLADAETINRSTVVLGPAEPAPSNDGNFVPLLTTTLDGTTPPGQVSGRQLAAHHAYRGVASELCPPDDLIAIRCIQDRYVDGVPDGSEQFSWNGSPPVSADGTGHEGAGNLGNVTCMHASGRNILQGADFEAESSDVPSGWTIDAGVAATNIDLSTAQVYHGSNALLLTPTGIASIQISQAITRAAISSLAARRMYCIAARVKMVYTSGSLAGTLTIGLTGTGYSPTTPTPEVQRLQISGTPTGGNYTITCPWSGLTTANIAHNATSATVQAALRALAGNEAVTVTTAAGAPPDVTHELTLHGIQGNVPQLTADITGLTGGSPAKTITTVTPGVAGDTISIPSTALPTSWMLAYCFVALPEVLPDDLKLIVRWNGTPVTGYLLYIDDMAMATVDYQAGHGLVIARGNLPTVRDDHWEYTVTNTEGVVQRAMRRMFGKQLPSSGSPTILDSVAT